MIRQLLIFLVAMAMASRAVHATDPYIVQQGIGNEVSSGIPGQSVRMPSGGPWDQLGFSWYDENLSPAAFGVLLILDQAYTGEPQQLGANTPGFIGRAAPDSNRESYSIPAEITLFPSRNYYFYTSTPFTGPLSRSTADPHAMGVAYEATSPFVELPGTDWAFGLWGQVVPEPTGMMLCLFMLGLLLAIDHRMR